jgi:hypothetical protein
MNNRENNKIIAEFLGAKKTDIQGIQKPVYYPIMGKSVYEDRLKFHSDWNCLMAVVEKIESFEDENRCAKFNVIIEQTFVEIISRNDNLEEIVKLDSNTKIEAVYKACVEFINWYNQQKN